MNKELLLKLAADYAALAENLKKLADEEAPAESKKEEQADVEEKKETVKQEKYTMADVRKKLSGLSSDGKTAEVRGLLVKHGANRLSEIKPEDYAVLMEEAEKL